MLKRSFFFSVFYLLLLISCHTAPVRKESGFTGESLLPPDSTVVTGRLTNGLTYYLKKNGKPTNRISLRLVVKAGSVLEDDDQKGLAHFLEHMAFKGTTHFEKSELVDYLERIGMKFGPEVNAYTSFNETVYILELPADNPKIIRAGLQILADWATGIRLDSAEIEKEKGVILEEWRQRLGASSRIREKHLPVLLEGSRYPERLPIGDPDIIKHASRQLLLRFYRQWYRPELMAVIAVGDFLPDSVQHWLEQSFSFSPPDSVSPERPEFDVPFPRETRISMVADSEVTTCSVGIYKFYPPLKYVNVEDLRNNLVDRLIFRMVNKRLYEKLTGTRNPAYLYASVSRSNFIPSLSFFGISFGSSTANLKSAFAQIRMETERVKKFGFAQKEFELARQELLKYLENRFNEKDKTQSSYFVSQLMDHFLNSDSYLSIEDEYVLSKEILASIQLKELNRVASDYFTLDPVVILIDYPAQESQWIPPKDSLLRWINEPTAYQLTPYQVKALPADLMEEQIVADVQVQVNYDSTMEYYRFTLPNGVRILAKPTRFKEEQIVFRFFSEGGTSRLPDSLFFSAEILPSVINQSGVGQFPYIDLTRMMAGKNAIVRAFLDNYSEGFIGYTTNRDLEEAFKLLYLYLKQPRIDTIAYSSYVTRLKEYLRNKENQPKVVFSDTISCYLYEENIRKLPWDTLTLERISFHHFREIYDHRFRNGDAFTMVIVGSFDPDTLLVLAKKYLAGLPANGRIESWEDDGIRYRSGQVKKYVYRGKEPVASVELIYTAPVSYSVENRIKMYMISEMLKIKFREVLREEKGGTYGVSVDWDIFNKPVEGLYFSVSFSCDPIRLDSLLKETYAVLDSVSRHGFDDLTLEKVRNAFFRSREIQIENNSFWLGLLTNIARGEFPENYFEQSDRLVKILSNKDLIPLMKTLFDEQNRKLFVLLPESGGNGNDLETSGISGGH